MKYSLKRVAVSALTTLAVAGSLTVGATSSASAIDRVDCGPSDYLSLALHEAGGVWQECYANAGVKFIGDIGEYGKLWVTQISTGNNVVRWYGDGRWQPDQPIGKWTIYIWPNHPGGVSIDSVAIY
ncbi:beta/gamma crystallin domain-containing protein [Streptomyces sp. NPDC006739]|uniref:beta/gamma crystallin domain-containing protein n=1 Tax=Streptomyces sp. NPDC006739 TaxID=3364763 RepID=UPI003696B246